MAYFPNKDKEGENKSSNFEGVSESAANHVAIISENPASNSETQQPVEPGENSSRARKGPTLTRTWTRIARPAQEFEDGRKNGSGSRSKRSFMEVDGSEVQNKKRLVLYNSKTILPVAEADDQPAKSNESPMLELSGAWEPSDRTGARGFNPGTRSFSCVLSRNMAG